MGSVWRSQRDFRDHALHEYDTGDAANARRMMGIMNSSVIIPSDGEALVYFHIADNIGHPLAREYLRTLDALVRDAKWLGPRISQEAAEKAKYWFPPYEFYPMGDAASGVPHTDECTIGFERERALALVGIGVPFHAVQQGLWFLGLTGRGGRAEVKAIARFQATLGDAPNGHIEPFQVVRLIQTAAVRGDAVLAEHAGRDVRQGRRRPPQLCARRVLVQQGRRPALCRRALSSGRALQGGSRRHPPGSFKGERLFHGVGGRGLPADA